MPFLVLVLCQLGAGANDVCDTFDIFVESLQSRVSLVLSILHSTELVLVACFRAARWRISLSLSSSPFLNNCHSLLSLWYSVSLTNCPCSAFSFHSFNRLSFFSLLLTLTMYFFYLSSAAAVSTRTSLLNVAHFAKLQFSSSAKSLTHARPRPPSLLGV